MTRELMTGVDAAWLHMDRAANTADVVSVMTFEDDLSADDLHRVLTERFLRHARFHQRIVPGRLSLATWEDDPAFALDRHVFDVKLASADERALDAFAGEVASERLDPDRPLWRVYRVQRPGAGTAVVTKLHHCIGDGFALVGVLLGLADELATEAPGTPHRMRAFRDLRPPEGAARALWNALHDPGRALDLAVDAAAFARSLAGMAVLPPARPTVLGRPLTGERRAAWSRPLPVRALRDVARARGATVNDVLVASLAGALRGHLADRGEDVDRFDLRALVPVNLRSQLPPALDGALGNLFGLVFLGLPIHAASARDRLALVAARMAELKRSPDAIVSFAVLQLIGHLPGPLEWLVTEFFSRKASLVVTNVPGPREPLHLAGHLIRGIAFCVPHPAALGLGVSIMSYAGEVRVGARSDVGVIPDPHDVVARIAPELAALEDAPRPAATPASTAASVPVSIPASRREVRPAL